MGMQGQSGGQNMKGQQMGSGASNGANMKGGSDMKGGMGGQNGMSGMQQGQPFSMGGQSTLWQPNMGNYTGATNNGMGGGAPNLGQAQRMAPMPGMAGGGTAQYGFGGTGQAFQGMGQGFNGAQGPQSPWSSQSNPAAQTGAYRIGNMQDAPRQAMGNTANIFGGT